MPRRLTFHRRLDQLASHLTKDVRIRSPSRIHCEFSVSIRFARRPVHTWRRNIAYPITFPQLGLFPSSRKKVACQWHIQSL
jgi:hypothetical protein